jgi:glycosyltransferase involved in cell wall biosynthesis
MKITRRNLLSRILHLVASNSMSGPEKQLVHHARDTRYASYEVVIGSFQEDSGLPEVLALASRCGIETVSIPGGVRPALVDDLADYLCRHRIDLICTHGYKANVVGHFAAKHAQVPWVPFVHGFTEESWQITLYERLERSLLVRSPWVVCTSAAQARELGRMRRGRPAPVVIPNAVLAPKETSIAQPRTVGREGPRIAGRPFVFGAVGRLSREKGHRFLVDAFAQVKKMLPAESIELLVLGEGPEETALRAQVRRLGLESIVCFAGVQAKPASWMKGMDCLVHPSIAAGAPNSVLEAMLLGVPVIATAVGGVPDVIENGETGLLVDPESPAALAEAMKKMFGSASLRKQMASGAQRHIRRNFSPDRQRSLLESLYETMLGSAFAAGVEESVHVVA